jgi:DNA polymerase III epsilon subunit-like protein
MLLHYRDELERTPPNRRIKRVGVFDTETTDITGYIVSYAFVIEKWPEQEVELEEYQLLNPEASISEESQEIHKIKAEELENKPTFREIKDHFLGLFKKVDMVVGHNVFFDMGVVKRELERLSHFPPIVEKPIFDTMFFSADLVTLDKKKMPRLEEVAEQLLGQRGGVTYHNALEDVKVTLRVFNYLLTASIK